MIVSTKNSRITSTVYTSNTSIIKSVLNLIEKPKELFVISSSTSSIKITPDDVSGGDTIVIYTESDGLKQLNITDDMITNNTKSNIDSTLYNTSQFDLPNLPDGTSSILDFSIDIYGMYLYVLTDNQYIVQYKFGTRFDISSLQFIQSIQLPDSSNITNFTIDPEGRELLAISNSTSTIYIYLFGTQHDLSTITALYKSYSLSTEFGISNVKGLSYDPYGAYVFMLAESPTRLFQFSVSRYSYDKVKLSPIYDQATELNDVAISPSFVSINTDTKTILLADTNNIYQHEVTDITNIDNYNDICKINITDNISGLYAHNNSVSYITNTTIKKLDFQADVVYNQSIDISSLNLTSNPVYVYTDIIKPEYGVGNLYVRINDVSPDLSNVSKTTVNTLEITLSEDPELEVGDTIIVNGQEYTVSDISSDINYSMENFVFDYSVNLADTGIESDTTATYGFYVTRDGSMLFTKPKSTVYYKLSKFYMTTPFELRTLKYDTYTETDDYGPGSSDSIYITNNGFVAWFATEGYTTIYRFSKAFDITTFDYYGYLYDDSNEIDASWDEEYILVRNGTTVKIYQNDNCFMNNKFPTTTYIIDYPITNHLQSLGYTGYGGIRFVNGNKYIIWSDVASWNLILIPITYDETTGNPSAFDYDNISVFSTYDIGAPRYATANKDFSKIIFFDDTNKRFVQLKNQNHIKLTVTTSTDLPTDTISQITIPKKTYSVGMKDYNILSLDNPYINVEYQAMYNVGKSAVYAANVKYGDKILSSRVEYKEKIEF